MVGVENSDSSQKYTLDLKGDWLIYEYSNDSCSGIPAKITMSKLAEDMNKCVLTNRTYDLYGLWRTYTVQENDT